MTEDRMLAWDSADIENRYSAKLLALTQARQRSEIGEFTLSLLYLSLFADRLAIELHEATVEAHKNLETAGRATAHSASELLKTAAEVQTYTKNCDQLKLLMETVAQGCLARSLVSENRPDRIFLRDIKAAHKGLYKSRSLRRSVHPRTRF